MDCFPPSRPRRPGAERPRFSRQAKCVLCLPRARAIRRANRAGADTRPRPHANARDKGSLRCRACLVEREPNERSRRTPCPSSSLPSPPAGEPSATTIMAKHELTCHSMTHRNSPPVQPASPAGAPPPGQPRPARKGRPSPSSCPPPISSCPDLFRASPSTASPRAAAWIPGTSPGMTEEPVLSLSKGASGHDGGRRRPEPRPARVGAHADRPRFSRQARCVLHPSRARNQAREPRRRRHAPAPARKCAR